ncbi:hypothetical protein FDECE_16894 [Fusarium decemcellulare]|nr:hypothetical protein FDECE_16894 [Fusarium decemcellulare]
MIRALLELGANTRRRLENRIVVPFINLLVRSLRALNCASGHLVELFFRIIAQIFRPTRPVPGTLENWVEDLLPVLIVVSWIGILVHRWFIFFSILSPFYYIYRFNIVLEFPHLANLFVLAFLVVVPFPFSLCYPGPWRQAFI